MITKRASAERGSLNLTWLQAKYTFSFANYKDSNFMHFGNLRVLNDDILLPVTNPHDGFGFHDHRDMEIISIPVYGSIKHTDNIGNDSIIDNTCIQYMSAGTGIMHDETLVGNLPARMLQIWIFPDKKGYSPLYKVFSYANIHKLNALTPLVTNNNLQGSINIRQNAEIYLLEITQNNTFTINALSLSNNNKPQKLLLHFIQGGAVINNVNYSNGDGAFITNETTVTIKAIEHTKIVVFSLPN